MKKILTTLAVAVLASGQLTAQNSQVELRDVAGNVANGQLLVYAGAVDQGQAETQAFEVDVEVHVVGNEDRNLNVRRYELDVQTGTENYFCWGVCYNARWAGDSPVWEAYPQHALVVPANSSVSNFHAYHKPRGLIGVSRFRYVWFDVSNPLDSVWCDIEFQSGSVGVEELRTGVDDMQVFPNPSLGSNVEIKADLKGSTANTFLVVYNMVGERLRSILINSAQTRFVLTTTDLASGIYFATIEQNGTSLRSKRFVIAR